MRAEFSFPESFPGWEAFRDRMNRHFSRVDYRAVPPPAGADAVWSAHVMNSPHYFGLTWRDRHTLSIHGADLEPIRPVLEALGATQRPPAEIARCGPSTWEFKAAAAWESEGWVLFEAGAIQRVRFSFDAALLEDPRMALVRAQLLPTLPSSPDQEPRPLPEPEALQAALKALELGAPRTFLDSELSACVSSLAEWLDDRLATGALLWVAAYEDDE
jgi:hypothetical protein